MNQSPPADTARLQGLLNDWHGGLHEAALSGLETAITDGVTGAASLALQIGAAAGPAQLDTTSIQTRIAQAIAKAPPSPIVRRHQAFMRASGYGGHPSDPVSAVTQRQADLDAGDAQAGLELGLLCDLAGLHEAAAPRLQRAAALGSGHAIAARLRRAVVDGAISAPLRAQAAQLANTGHPLGPMLAHAVAALRETEEPELDPGTLDIDALVSALVVCPTGADALSEKPQITRWPRALCDSACDYLAAGAAPLLRPAQIFDPTIGQFRPDPYRQSLTATLGDDVMDLVLWAMKSRMAALVDATFDQGEALSVLLYRPGEHYKAHYDYLSEDGSVASADLAARGQRTGTSLIRLNEEFEGGDTLFKRLDLRWTGTRGDALSFVNVDEDGAGDPMTLHSGEPVTSGMKVLASLWTRER